MREFLQDVHEHMDDGYGRAQAHAKVELRQRFYTKVDVAPHGESFCINLDGRPTKTPGRKLVMVPNEALARIVAREWETQEEFIDPRTMPFVRLTNSAVEGGVEAESELRAEVVRFAGNDLLLFHADSPRELVELQKIKWGAALEKIQTRFKTVFEPVTGIVSKSQPQKSLDVLEKDLADLDYFGLAALVSITGLTGSGLLAMGLRRGLFSPDEAWELAHLDENYNAKNWGADAEATARLEKRRIEFDAAVSVLKLVDGA